MNGYISHTEQFMEALAKRDNRCKGGWRLVPPRETVAPGVDPDLPDAEAVGEAALDARQMSALSVWGAVFPDDPSYSIDTEDDARDALNRGKVSLSTDRLEKLKALIRLKYPGLGEAALDAKRRKQLDDSDFALPGRRYPVDTPERARVAIKYAKQYESPENQAKVIAAVKRRYPDMDVKATPDKKKKAKS
ncbi:hypothetical protein [Streptomyces sp. 5-10]|uniref:hypothetical protein n=1 Tax=Streptomyces sp. 5-10 TaxID=878925 RepID=UPI00168B3F96|nr:hypothetical protein [Streptomyces sp. 5-10]MBD3004720.1 hypothetical protein [Streptomyces sp. 5-10]